MSEARRRNSAVCLSAGSGVVGLWEERKLSSQAGSAWSDLAARWLAICVDRLVGPAMSWCSIALVNRSWVLLMCHRAEVV